MEVKAEKWARISRARANSALAQRNSSKSMGYKVRISKSLEVVEDQQGGGGTEWFVGIGFQEEECFLWIVGNG